MNIMENYRYIENKSRDLIEKHLNTRNKKIILNIMNKVLQDANESFLKSNTYNELQRKKTFSTDMHKSLTNTLKKDIVPKNTDMKIEVINGTGIYNEYRIKFPGLIINIKKSERNKLPEKSSKRKSMSKSNYELSGQKSIFDMKEDIEKIDPSNCYALLTYDFIHNIEEKETKFEFIDILVPNDNYDFILYTEKLLRKEIINEVTESQNKEKLKKFSIKKVNKDSEAVE